MLTQSLSVKIGATRFNLFTRILIGTLLSGLAELQAQGPTEAMRIAARMNQLPSRFDFGAISSRDGFVALLRMVKKPGGAVTVRIGDCESETRRFFALPAGMALDGALDAVVTIENTSYWVMNNSAINLLPTEGVPSIMQVRIPEFEWDTSDNVSIPIGRLFSTGVVRTYLERLHLIAGLNSITLLQKPPRIVNGIIVRDAPAERHSIRDVPLLEALNTIVASYDDRVWMYEERTCRGKNYYRISAQ